MKYIVAYDVENKRIQAKLREKAYESSVSGQKSAYECELSAKEKAELIKFMDTCLQDEQGRCCILKVNVNYWENIPKNHIDMVNDDYIYVG